MAPMVAPNSSVDPNPPPYGVLIVNLGTPDAPTPKAIRAYLKQFLSDSRVVRIPKLLWYCLLYGFILPFRPRKTSHAYQQIWRAEGSPLRVISQQQAQGLGAVFTQRGLSVPVVLGMTYGSPSLRDALLALRAQQIKRIVVLPLYPQYSATTTAAVFDQIAALLAKCPCLPELRFVLDYHQAPGYIQACVHSINEYWQTQGRPTRLLFSFHGIPQAYHLEGDPYPTQCIRSATLIAGGLGLREDEWQVSFQSRFGRAKWVEPYTLNTLRAWGAAGLSRVDVVSPGFAADCLETLEELNIQNRAAFVQAGGGEFHYIPALNDRADHLELLADLVEAQGVGWV